MPVEEAGPGDPADPAAPGPILPTREDPVVRAASVAIGGPWGRHGVVGQRRFWTPLRVLLALTLLTLSLGWAEKSPCQRAASWQNGHQYTHLCYSDIIPLFFNKGLDQGKIPYVDKINEPVEYPVLTGGFMAAAMELGRLYDSTAATSALPDLAPEQTYYIVTAALLGLCLLVVTWSTAILARRRVWDAAMVALAPVVVIHAFTNWDLLAVALAGAALVAWQRRRTGLAGVLLGLGAAAKLYPALFLVPLFALCLRTRKMAEFGWTLFGAVAAWMVVNLPIALAYPTAWKRFYELNRTRSADFDSLWYGLHYLIDRHAGRATNPPQVNTLAAVFVLLGLGAVALFAFRAPRRPRLPQVLFLTVAVFLLTNKVWSPQYTLWLVPLAVLARPSWPAFLGWQATECVLWVPRLLWFLGTDHKGVDFQWFLLAVLVRDAALLVYCGLVVWDILHPEADRVRASGVDDPAGGVLDGADDAPPPWAMSAVGVSTSDTLVGSAGSEPAGPTGSDPEGNASREPRNTT
jgi:uncharacterized membrane protein